MFANKYFSTRVLLLGSFSITGICVSLGFGKVWTLKEKKKRIGEKYSNVSTNPNLFGSHDFKLYRYNGYVFPSHIALSGFFEEFESFQFVSDDIVVSSFPKSGTTWVQEIVYMLCHNFEKSDGSSEVLETRFPYIEYPYPGLKHIASMNKPRFLKTHLPLTFMPKSLEQSGAKVIYIVRNPRDVAVSYFYFAQMLNVVKFQGTFDEFASLFLDDIVPYGPYFEHIESYKGSESKNILILTYEDLKKNPFNIVQQIAAFLKVEMTSEQLDHVVMNTTFSRMAENPSVNYEHWKEIGFSDKGGPSFFRKGTVGDWKNHFTPTMAQAFEDWEDRHS